MSVLAGRLVSLEQSELIRGRDEIRRRKGRLLILISI